MLICTNYSDTKDFFAYTIVFGPDFPSEDQMTIERALDNLMSGIDATEVQFGSSQCQTLLQECRSRIDLASQCFRIGEKLQADKHLQNAYHSFLKLPQLVHRKR